MFDVRTFNTGLILTDENEDSESSRQQYKVVQGSVF